MSDTACLLVSNSQSDESSEKTGGLLFSEKNQNNPWIYGFSYPIGMDIMVLHTPNWHPFLQKKDFHNPK